MEPISGANAELHQQLPASGISLEPTIYQQMRGTFSPSDQPQSEQASCDSPGGKRVREMEELSKSWPIQPTPEKMSAMTFKRPKSSGDETSALPQYQMATANLRVAQVKLPNLPKVQVNGLGSTVSPGQELHSSSQPEPVSAAEGDSKAHIAAHTPSANVPVTNTPCRNHLSINTAMQGGTTSVQLIQKAGNAKTSSERQVENLAAADIPPDTFPAVVKHNGRGQSTLFNFAPAKSPAQSSSRPTIPEADHLSRSSVEPDKVLPSIEDTSIGAEGNEEEPSDKSALHVALNTPKPKSYPQIQPAAPRAQRQTSVLDGRVVKGPPLHAKGMGATSQTQSHSVSEGVRQPSEEDLLYLLMHRTRRAKNRELELEAGQKKLNIHFQQLQKQNKTANLQLLAANGQIERQNTQIAEYRTKIDEFKATFTKFKSFAKDLSKDYTDMGRAMKKISNTADELVQEKVQINQSLESIREASTSTTKSLLGFTPRISKATQDTAELQHELKLANERVRITSSSLQNERLRNNRIETQILGFQQVSERQSLSLVQENRQAASYLHELCQAVLYIGEIATKKQHVKDTPAVKRCYALLQGFIEKQESGFASLLETKNLVDTISERLLSFHTSAEKAAKTATVQGEQLNKDLKSQIITSIADVGLSMRSEIDFAKLQCKVTALQTRIAEGDKSLNVANKIQNASEAREEKQSGRVDVLLEQLAEASKREQQSMVKSKALNPSVDLNVILTKYMQACTSLSAAQSRANQKEAELTQKLNELQALREELKTVKMQSEAWKSGLSELQEQHDNLQGQTDGALQENMSLKEQIAHLKSASARIADVTASIESLAEKDAELAKLRPHAAEIQELSRKLAGREKELKGLKLEVSKIPALAESLQKREIEVGTLKIQAEKIPVLVQNLATKDSELRGLREDASLIPELKRTVASKETELRGLHSEVSGYEAAASTFESERNGYVEAIRKLEQKLASATQQQTTLQRAASDAAGLQTENAGLKTKISHVRKAAQSLESELAKSRSSVPEVEALKGEIKTLRTNLGDQNQLKRDFATQKKAHIEAVTSLGELQNQLGESRKTSDQVPHLQKKVQDLTDTCGNLNRRLNEATEFAELYQTLQHGSEQKQKELLSLRSKLEGSEKTAAELVVTLEESQRKSKQLAALQKDFSNLQAESRGLVKFQRTYTSCNSNETYSTQETPLEEDDQNYEFEHDAARSASEYFTAMQNTKFRRDTDQDASATRNAESRSGVRLNPDNATSPSKSQHSLRRPTKSQRSSQQVPDSQPQTDLRNLLRTSSPLSEIESPSRGSGLVGDVKRKSRDTSDNHPPSSSYGGDSMLLEDFEAMESLIEHSFPQNQAADIPAAHRTQKHGHGATSSQPIVTKDGAGSRQRRMRDSSPVVEETQSQEHRPTSPDMLPSSPAGPLKHLPNSAIKRPRLNPIEATPSSQASSKRLKRTPANLDVKQTSNRPTPSSTQLTEPEPTRANQVLLPSGSRAGSIIGLKAPAPGKAQSSRKPSRRGSKTSRYAERFNNE